MIHIVTDSTADLTAADAQALNVSVVPLTVMFGEDQYRDGIDLSADEFYKRLAEGGEPKTSQPSPEAFAAVYRELLADPAAQVVSIHVSSKLSGTLQSANLAAAEFGDRVATFDSLMVSGGVQLFVRLAARMVADGIDRDEIIAAMKVRRDLHHLYILFDTITYLHKGGRIGGAQAFVGGILGVKPLLEIREGLVEPHARVRSRQKGLAMLADLVNSHGTLDAIEVMYTTEPDVAAAFAKELQEKHPELKVTVGQIGPVVGTYSGPGLIGVAVWATS